MVTPCGICHPARDPGASLSARFRLGLGSSCADCHADDDPHAGQFEDRPCDSCHGSRTFLIDEFDHDRARYKLDGAHLGLDCAQCHPSEPTPGGGLVVRYRPIGTECTDCHGGGV